VNGRVKAVLRKEFREYRRNKLIVFTMAGVPIIFFVLIALGTFGLPEDAPPGLIRSAVGQTLLFFLLIPVILPTTVAAYSIIGEREQGTIEPVLTTPVTDRELLSAKALAAVLPSVLLAWAMFVLYVVLAAAVAPRAVVDRILAPDQIVAQLVMAPALAGFAIVVSILISLRSTDIRVAQQLSGLASFPVLGLLALGSFEVVRPSITLYVVAAAAIAAIDLAGWRLAVRLFDPERLLTRYGAPGV
jgi:ABC-2 type transport system permease protein